MQYEDTEREFLVDIVWRAPWSIISATMIQERQPISIKMLGYLNDATGTRDLAFIGTYVSVSRKPYLLHSEYAEVQLSAFKWRTARPSSIFCSTLEILHVALQYN